MHHNSGFLSFPETIRPLLMVELQLSDSSNIDTEPSFFIAGGSLVPLCACRGFPCVSCALSTVLLVARSDSTFLMV